MPELAQQNYLLDIELGCRSGAAYPELWRATRLSQLRETFNAIRVSRNAAVRVVCAYRDPVFNAQLRKDSIARLIAAGRTPEQAEKETGVAKRSQHMEGRALDICPASLPVKASLWTIEHYTEMRRFCAMIGQLYAKGALPFLGGFGTYPRWAHIDTRESATLITWQGS